MLRLLIPTGSGYTWVEHAPPAPFPDEFLWADLFEPTTDEEKAVEALLTVDVPTRDEMREIETSNRLYEENGAVYMTATVGSNLDSDNPERSQITFILANNRLISTRYVDPTPVLRFMSYVERSPIACTSSATLLAGLLEAAAIEARVTSSAFYRSLQVKPRRDGLIVLDEPIKKLTLMLLVGLVTGAYPVEWVKRHFYFDVRGFFFLHRNLYFTPRILAHLGGKPHRTFERRQESFERLQSIGDKEFAAANAELDEYFLSSLRRLIEVRGTPIILALAGQTPAGKT